MTICPRCACPADATDAEIIEYRTRYETTRPLHEKVSFECVKCSGHTYESGVLRAAGGALSSVFDISTNKFRFITCTSCGYTEFYRADIGALGIAAEFLGS